MDFYAGQMYLIMHLDLLCPKLSQVAALLQGAFISPPNAMLSLGRTLILGNP